MGFVYNSGMAFQVFAGVAAVMFAKGFGESAGIGKANRFCQRNHGDRLILKQQLRCFFHSSTAKVGPHGGFEKFPESFLEFEFGEPGSLANPFGRGRVSEIGHQIVRSLLDLVSELAHLLTGFPVCCRNLRYSAGVFRLRMAGNLSTKDVIAGRPLHSQ